jgi:hypothetical protein
MTTLGFTGTQRGMTPAQRRALIDVIDRFADRGEFHHGVCIGADEEAHELVHPRGWKMCLHPPTNMKKVSAHCPGDVYYEPLPYLARNDMIVAAAEHLIAAPYAPEDNPGQKRSGTWYTVRRARMRGIPVTIIWPDGRVEEEIRSGTALFV